jgi:hypothetical protein
MLLYYLPLLIPVVYVLIRALRPVLQDAFGVDAAAATEALSLFAAGGLFVLAGVYRLVYAHTSFGYYAGAAMLVGGVGVCVWNWRESCGSGRADEFRWRPGKGGSTRGGVGPDERR